MMLGAKEETVEKSGKCVTPVLEMLLWRPATKQRWLQAGRSARRRSKDIWAPRLSKLLTDNPGNGVLSQRGAACFLTFDKKMNIKQVKNILGSAT